MKWSLSQLSTREVIMDEVELRKILDAQESWARGEGGARANLSEAYLSEAYLSEAYLSRADLSEAYLLGARLPSPTALLLARWEPLPAEVVVNLMRLDASAHPKGSEVFDAWAEGGPCPYDGCRFERVANFFECRRLWSPGKPPTIWEACKLVLDHCCPGWDKEAEEEFDDQGFGKA